MTTLTTGGLLVSVHTDRPRWRDQLLDGAGGPEQWREDAGNTGITSTRPDVILVLDGSPARFDTTGLRPVTRGVWSDPCGAVVLDDVGSSGFAQLWQVRDGQLRVHSRWTPSRAERAAAKLLPERFRALRTQVLLHYPVLWAALLRGMAPLHVSLVEVAGRGVLLAGPGGVGKSTLVTQELRAGGRAACDNLAVSDGGTVHGLREPLRLHREDVARLGLLPAGTKGATRAMHGRRETPWNNQADALAPALVAVVRRGSAAGPYVRPATPAAVARALVAGTYAAGELSRFWPLAAQLALATGHGPAHPPVEAVATALADRLPCRSLELGIRPGSTLRSLLVDDLNPTPTTEAAS